MTIFSKIIGGEIPCYKVGEDADNFAFLDINPLVEGHTLVVPKVEVDKFFDLSEEQLTSLMAFARKVARGMEQRLDCKRVAVVVLGLDVPHAHVHLIPLKNGASDIDFSKEKLRFSPEEFAAIAKKIAPATGVFRLLESVARSQEMRSISPKVWRAFSKARRGADTRPPL